MLGVKTIEQPITAEYLDILKDNYQKSFGEPLENIIKNDTHA